MSKLPPSECRAGQDCEDYFSELSGEFCGEAEEAAPAAPAHAPTLSAQMGIR